jgi:excisionase family DNA binding protein
VRLGKGEEKSGMKFYTTTQAAQILGISSKRVCILINEGRLPAEKNNGAWQIQVSDFWEFAKHPKLKPWGKRHLQME